MTTFRKYKKYWTEVKSVKDGEVKGTVCCCKGAGLTRKECQLKSGHKNPCRCNCHAVHKKEM